MTIETFKKAETVVRRIESLKNNIELLEELINRPDMPGEIQFSFHDGSNAGDNIYRPDYYITGPRNNNKVDDIPGAKKEYTAFLKALLEDYKTRLDEAEKQLAQI